MEQIFGLIISVIFGAIFGSYATLFAYRLPRGESCFGRYFGPKSRCPKCQNTILTRDLIPLFNWIITFGKCRNCKEKIPRIHLFVELLTTVLFVFCYLNFGFSESFIIHALIASSLVILLATDITHKVFPQQILISLLLFTILNRVLLDKTALPMVYSALLGIAISSLFYKTIYKKFPKFFSDKEHFFNYVKFLLIASLSMSIHMFLYYTFVVMITLTILSYFKVLSQRNSISLGYIFIIPFLWLMIISPFSPN